VEGSNADVDAIAHAIEAFEAAFARGDVEEMMTVYSDDLVYMPDGRETDFGRTTTRMGLQQLFARYSGRLRVTTDEITVSGDLAFDRGEIVMDLTDRDSGVQRQVHKRFLEVWRREPEGWRIVRVMNNDPLPARQAAR
jgi:uncharacterized protein (TIGR02246 family)